MGGRGRNKRQREEEVVEGGVMSRRSRNKWSRHKGGGWQICGMRKRRMSRRWGSAIMR